MPAFLDKNGKSWPVELTVDSLWRIKDQLGVDLTDAIHYDKAPALIDRIADDPFMICRIVHLAAAPDVDEREFARAFDGDAIERAWDAVLESTLSFSRSQQRPLLAKIHGKAKQVESRQVEKAMAALDAPEFQQQVENELKSGRSSTASPAPLASTPAR